MKNLLNASLFLSYAICSGCGLIILKLAVTETKISIANFEKLLFDLKFIVGFTLYGTGFLLWIFILSKFRLNVAFPIAMSMFFIISSLGSRFILLEAFDIRSIIGIALCFFGILLIGIE